MRRDPWPQGPWPGVQGRAELLQRASIATEHPAPQNHSHNSPATQHCPLGPHSPSMTSSPILSATHRLLHALALALGEKNRIQATPSADTNPSHPVTQLSVTVHVPLSSGSHRTPGTLTNTELGDLDPANFQSHLSYIGGTHLGEVRAVLITAQGVGLSLLWRPQP